MHRFSYLFENLKSPLLNLQLIFFKLDLSVTDVRLKMNKNVRFWKKKLEIFLQKKLLFEIIIISMLCFLHFCVCWTRAWIKLFCVKTKTVFYFFSFFLYFFHFTYTVFCVCFSFVLFVSLFIPFIICSLLSIFYRFRLLLGRFLTGIFMFHLNVKITFFLECVKKWNGRFSSPRNPKRQ